jgi:type I restriction enzyme, S subunit
VPAHWAIRRVKHTFEFLNNRRIPLSSEERGGMERNFDYYGASGVIDRVESYLFDEPTLLVAEDGANLLSRSTPLAFVASGRYWVNNHAHILRPPTPSIEYWEGVLTTFDFTPLVSGSAQPKLTKEALGEVMVPVPPPAEQAGIAQALKRWSTQIGRSMDAVQAGVSGLTEYRSTLITSAVTGRIDVRVAA